MGGIDDGTYGAGGGVLPRSGLEIGLKRLLNADAFPLLCPEDGVASKVTTPLGATERSDKGLTIEPCRKVEVREAQSSLSVVRQVVTKPTMPASQPISKAPISVVKTPFPGEHRRQMWEMNLR
jgi:hypothetical protein